MLHVRAGKHVQSAVQRRHAEHRRRAHTHPVNPRRRPVASVEGERRFVAEPAGQGRVDGIGQAGPHIDKGRRAWPAIEIFVTAAHRKIRPAAGQVYRKSPGGMGQIPHHQGTRRTGFGGEGGHVVQAARAIVHLRQHQHGDGFVNGRFHCLRFHQLEAVALAQQPHGTFGHIQVGGEIAGVGEDGAALPGQRQGGGQ